MGLLAMAIRVSERVTSIGLTGPGAAVKAGAGEAGAGGRPRRNGVSKAQMWRRSFHARSQERVRSVPQTHGHPAACRGRGASVMCADPLASEEGRNLTVFAASAAAAVQSAWALGAAVRVELAMGGGQRNGGEADGLAAAIAARWGWLSRQRWWQK